MGRLVFRISFTLLVLSSLLLSACTNRPVSPPPHARAQLPPEVHLISSADMLAWCTAVDPEGACEDFRTPRTQDVTAFDARLPQFLVMRGRDDLARRIEFYVRQYWAVVRGGRLYVVGNFVCPSVLGDDDIVLDSGRAASTTRSVGQVPILVDDAGVCSITATFPADRPGEVTFQVG